MESKKTRLAVRLDSTTADSLSELMEDGDTTTDVVCAALNALWVLRCTDTISHDAANALKDAPLAVLAKMPELAHSRAKGQVVW